VYAVVEVALDDMSEVDFDFEMEGCGNDERDMAR